MKFYPYEKGGGDRTSFIPTIFPFCSPPVPLVNDQSFMPLYDIVKILCRPCSTLSVRDNMGTF